MEKSEVLHAIGADYVVLKFMKCLVFLGLMWRIGKTNWIRTKQFMSFAKNKRMNTVSQVFSNIKKLKFMDDHLSFRDR